MLRVSHPLSLQILMTANCADSETEAGGHRLGLGARSRRVCLYSQTPCFSETAA